MAHRGEAWTGLAQGPRAFEPLRTGQRVVSPEQQQCLLVGVAAKIAGVDLLAKSLPYVLPLALAAVTAAVGPAMVTPRRLRNDLVIDTELVDKLPLQERTDLREDIRRRARHLIAIMKYPSVTFFDLLVLLGFTGIAVVLLVGDVLPAHRAGETPQLSDPMTTGGWVAALTVLWSAFYIPWASRAKARLLHIQQHLGKDEAKEVARTVRVADWAALIAGCIVIVGLPTSVSIVSYQAGDPAVGWSIAFGGFFGATGLALLAASSWGAGLSGHLITLTDLGDRPY